MLIILEHTNRTVPSIGLTLMKRFPDSAFFRITDKDLGHTQIAESYVATY